jgi:hypothetical protein
MTEVTADEASKTVPEPSEPHLLPLIRQIRIKSADSVKTRFRHALQLQTVEDGYNSGRTYYLQASSDERCKTICDSITRHARRARRAAEAQSRLRRAQSVVLAVYESTPFQSAIAVLILAVSGRRTRARKRVDDCPWKTASSNRPRPRDRPRPHRDHRTRSVQLKSGAPWRSTITVSAPYETKGYAPDWMSA